MTKFTPEAERVLDAAESYALKTGSMLESVHLLAALTQVEECTACRILHRFGFTDKIAESYLVTVSDRNTGRVLVSPVTRKIIGGAGLRNILGDGEITNVAILSKYRGKGYGKTSAQLCIQYLYKTLTGMKVVAKCHQDNVYKE